MGLLRLLLLVAVAWFVWRLLLRAALSAPQAKPSRSGKEDYLPLAKCTLCGAHVPQPADGAAAICERCRSR